MSANDELTRPEKVSDEKVSFFQSPGEVDLELDDGRGELNGDIEAPEYTQEETNDAEERDEQREEVGHTEEEKHENKEQGELNEAIEAPEYTQEETNDAEERNEQREEVGHTEEEKHENKEQGELNEAIEAPEYTQEEANDAEERDEQREEVGHTEEEKHENKEQGELNEAIEAPEYTQEEANDAEERDEQREEVGHTEEEKHENKEQGELNEAIEAPEYTQEETNDAEERDEQREEVGHTEEEKHESKEQGEPNKDVEAPEYTQEGPFQADEKKFLKEQQSGSEGELSALHQHDLAINNSSNTRLQGDEEREFPPHTQEVHHLFKPRKTQFKVPVRWDPIECELREDSDDEFEVSTALRPVYEDEGVGVPVFKNGEPDYHGEFLSCFGEPNLLYRIYNREEKTWAFYNDTYQYEMHVHFTFGKHSRLEALENTTLHVKSTGEYVAEVFVYPGETERFIKGTANGFTSKLRAVPLTDAYYHRRQELAEEMIQKEIDQIKRVVGDETNAEVVLRACVKNNLPFVDLEFPPCQASLETGGKKPFKPLFWARPSSYVGQDLVDQVRLFRGPLHLSGVEQGELGDSWLMCSVAAVLEHPPSVLKMFRHPTDPEMGKKERAVGGYRVTFNKNGLWRSVIVDSYLPISGGKPKYARSRSDPAELWPSILQKAFAKLHGSYANVSSGDPLHALQDLTGYPSCRFDEDFTDAARTGNDALFRDWMLYIQANYRIILSTPGKDKINNSDNTKLSKRYQSVGLLTGHAYTVLDAKHFPEHELRLVKIRNAWGRSSEWSGDWSDNDEKWEQYPDVARACNFEKADDGTFWMTWEATLHYFNGGGVSFFQPTLNDYRVPSTFVGRTPSCVLEISVEQPTRMCFTISQQDKRGHPGAGEYQPVMLSIAQPVEASLYKVVQNSSANAYRPLDDKWTFFQARDVSMIYKFLPEKSPYLVVPRLMPMDQQAEVVPYVLGISCNRVVGQDGITVQFKTMDKDNRVMHNFPKFEPETEPVAVEYQVRLASRGFPELKTGFSVS